MPRHSLDDRTYADLREEALTVVAEGRSGWTDFNTSDPGLTVLELFAFLAEALVYRTNRVTAEDVEGFLRLVNGPTWEWRPEPGEPPEARAAALAEEVRRTRLSLRHEERAVTGADYERLAGAVDGVHRAVCMQRRHVDAGPDIDRPGHVTVVVVPNAGADGAAVCAAVAEHLGPRRLLGTHVHVTMPVAAPVSARLLVRSRRDVTKDALRSALTDALAAQLNDRRPGEPLRVSAVRAALEQVPGVDVLSGIELASPVATPEHHDAGPLVGLTGRPHEQLVLARRDGEPDVEVALARELVTVQVRVRVTLSADRPLATPRAVLVRTVVAAVAAWFPPQPGDLDLDNTGWGRQHPHRLEGLRDHVLASLAKLSAGRPADAQAVDLEVATTPQRVLGDAPEHMVWFERDELPHVRCEVEVVSS